jgi:lipoyl(octanoyl) transferase
VRWLENGLVDALSRLGFPAVRRETPRGHASLAVVWLRLADVTNRR